MIRAIEFSPMIGVKVVQDIVKKMKETKDYIVDFSGTEFVNYSHEEIAKAVVFEGLTPINIRHDKDRNLIEYNKTTLMQPKVENIGQFTELMKKRFPIGSIAIYDESLVKTTAVDSKRKIIMIESYNDKNMTVIIRKYRQSLNQPIFYRTHGYNSNVLYELSEVSLVSLYNNEIIIDYPRDKNERALLDILFCEQNNFGGPNCSPK